MPAAGALLAAAAPARAHFDVLPADLTVGVATELTVRVPTERDVPTTRVRVDVPSQVTVFSLGQPPAGWTATAVKGSDGKIASIVWSGGSIPPGRYADFTVLGTPFTEGEAVWPARQGHADGLVKPWTGSPEDEAAGRSETGPTDPGPAARTTIAPEGTVAGAIVVAGDDESGAAIWLGVIAIGIAVLAALGTGLLWSTRPARLPPDDGPSA